MAKLHKLDKFTVVSNEWLKDKDLSLKAKGLLCVLQSLPDDWNFSIAGLVAILREGTDCVQATIHELRDAGFITWRRERNEKGQFDVVVELHEKRQPQSNDHSGKPTVAKTAQYNKEIKEINKNDNTKVLSLEKSVETAVVANNETSLQKTTYGSERINQAFTWWQEAFGYELKPSQANRRAVWNMLRAKNKGEQWVKQMLALLVEAKKDKYSGIRIANYADLQRDWEKLMAWGSSRYEQRSSNEDEFDRLVSQL